MNLDDQIADFLAKADCQAAPSKLEPYADLIRGLRQRRWTYSRIAAVLKERFGLATAPSTIHDFVRVRARRPKMGPLSASQANPALGAAPGPAPQKRRFHLDA
jgi:transposase